MCVDQVYYRISGLRVGEGWIKSWYITIYGENIEEKRF